VNVLVVDDEPAVRGSLRRALGLEGYEISTADDGQDALEALAEYDFEAVILDIAMPGIDGIEVCRRVRRSGDRTPILMLTARDAVDDRVAGLDAGADDYLSKPFALRELVARLRALMRRTEVVEEPVVRFDDLTLNRQTREVRRGDRDIELTRTEFSLLELLMDNPRLVLTRSQIFEHVWGYDFGPTSNSLGVYVGYLRRKLEVGGEPRLIQTIRGVGYSLRQG
jgi:two-component system, OmpR family, response regulator MprA